jgi:hypothetical protein
VYRVIDGRGSGKTGRLMLLAKENNGVLVCYNPDAMRYKARAYGLVGFDIISYRDFVDKNYETEKPVFIDELELFLKREFGNFAGYSLTNED